MFKFLLSLILFAAPSHAAVSEADKALIFSKNILTNGGFEPDRGNNNRITNAWTASGGTFSAVTSGANLLVGKGSVTWDSSAASQTLTSNSVVIDKGHYGRNGAASCLIQVPSGTITHKLQVYDGSVVINEIDITSSAAPFRNSVNFIFPSSGSISIRIISVASDESLIAIDDCYLGPSEGYNTSSVSQATLIGHAYYGSTTNCTGWSRTNTAMGDFASDTDCPAPTVVSNAGPGTISTADNNLPQITVTNLPPGIYNVRAITAAGMSASAYARLAITDGTTTSAAAGFNSTSSTNEGVTVSGVFTYTATQSSVTFKLQGMSSSGSITLTNDYYENQFYIYRFPTSSEQAYTPDLQAMSWSGYHDNTCSWARTNTALGDPTADATCNLTERTNQNFGTVSTSGSVLPAITFTPKKVGRYYVCAHAKIAVGSANVLAGTRLWDGTTVINEAESVAATTSNNGSLTHSLCGVYVVSSISAKTLSVQSKISSGTVTVVSTGAASAIEWSIFSLDQSLPAPVLTNMVTTPASGGVRVCSGQASMPSTITSSSGSCASSLTGGATGFATVNFAAGTFSAVPYCTVSIIAGSGGYSRNCGVNSTPTTSALVVSCGRPLTETGENHAFSFHCIGAR